MQSLKVKQHLRCWGAGLIRNWSGQNATKVVLKNLVGIKLFSLCRFYYFLELTGANTLGAVNCSLKHHKPRRMIDVQ